MFGSVLIANRGEIAVRVIRTAQRLGMRTIAIYSEADASALHVRLADEAHLVGRAAPAESYLNGQAVLAAARASGAACLHPGYGFLAENAEFAAACARAGIAFVGPPPEAIALMGLKHEARALMARAGVPVVPGYDGEQQDVATLAREAVRIGYPVMLKPVAGGGGKGMRRVADADALAPALEGARREARSAFGEARMMLEKLLERPRHIEVQVFADAHGHIVHLYERDCSLQRRHQKIVEEAPAPGMTPPLRARMTEAAVAAARAVDYLGAGTVEFLVENHRLNGDSRFYFLEMNTRLQVEHPVTEAVTGLDLVEWQFRVAAGEPLPLEQGQIGLSGCAIEARLYAEDPERDFLPSTGTVFALRWPAAEAVRVDAGIVQGVQVSPYYDPMLAKLVAHAPTRDEAIARLAAALQGTLVAGPRTNLAFLHALLHHPAVTRGETDTELVDREAGGLFEPRDTGAAVAAGTAALLERRRRALAAARSRFSDEPRSPWDRGDAFVLGPARRDTVAVLADGERREVPVTWGEDRATGSGNGAGSSSEVQLVEAGEAVIAVADMRQVEIRFPDAALASSEPGEEGGVVLAPMHGRIAKVWAEKGANVRKGDRLAVLEAMKMEHVLHAPRDGVVLELGANEGAQLDRGAMVAVIGPGRNT